MKMRDLFEDDGGGTVGTVGPGKSRPDGYQTKPPRQAKRPRYQTPPAPKPAAPAAPATPAKPSAGSPGPT